jgi:putative membrane protein
MNAIVPTLALFDFISNIFGSVTYALLGIVIFITGFIIVDKLTPYDLWKQLVEEKNQALAIVVAASILGVCLIIAAAIH